MTRPNLSDKAPPETAPIATARVNAVLIEPEINGENAKYLVQSGNATPQLTRIEARQGMKQSLRQRPVRPVLYSSWVLLYYS